MFDQLLTNDGIEFDGYEYSAKKLTTAQKTALLAEIKPLYDSFDYNDDAGYAALCFIDELASDVKWGYAADVEIPETSQVDFIRRQNSY